MSDLDWRQSLANVRKAYRVVAAYQQRVQAMMKIAGREFEPLEFADWMATDHGMPPPRNKNPMWNWVWDLLPMNCCSVLLNLEGKRIWDIKTGECLVFCVYMSDTAFWEARQAHPRVSPDPDRLAPAGEATTCFRMMAFQWLADDRTVNCINDFWNAQHPENIGLTPKTSADGRWQVMFVEADLANLETEEAFTTHVRTFRDHVNTAFRLDKPLGAA